MVVDRSSSMTDRALDNRSSAQDSQCSRVTRYSSDEYFECNLSLHARVTQTIVKCRVSSIGVMSDVSTRECQLAREQ